MAKEKKSQLLPWRPWKNSETHIHGKAQFETLRHQIKKTESRAGPTTENETNIFLCLDLIKILLFNLSLNICSNELSTITFYGDNPCDIFLTRTKRLMRALCLISFS